MSGERGQSLILFTLMIATLSGIAGLVTDVGMVMRERTSLQAGVDAAALAGASALPDATEATALATEYAEKNGLSGTDVKLTVTTPYKGDPTKIEVSVKTKQSAYFTRALGADFFEVGARGVASMQATGGINAALLSLNATECKALNKSGTADINIINDGGIMVNSSCDPAIDLSGGGTISAALINYYEAGGYNESGSQFSPTPTPVDAPLADPLKDVPPPLISSLVTSIDSGGTALTPSTRTISNTRTLHPGVYYGGLAIKNNANVTLLPGIYVMAGGGFSVSGGSYSITGNGVMIYNTSDPVKPSGAGACGSIDLSGTGTWNYTPPSTGIYKGIALWQDKACTNDVKLTGSNGGPSGAIYAPTAMVNMSGSGSLGSIQVIADTFDISGSGDMTVDFVPWLTIPLDVNMRLVE